MGGAVAFRSWEDGPFSPTAEDLTRPKMRYRVIVFGRPRGPWRDTHAEAMQDAIDQELTAFDRSKREHFLAVPTDIEVRRAPR